ncbi:MAG: GAF domain-containing protein, partial [Terriglobales bacterium]
MSANPHNASLGLPENDLPGSEPLDNESAGAAESSVTLRDSAPTYSQGHEALQALLAFSCLHEQLRQRRALEKNGVRLDADVWQLEQFVLDEVLQLIAERALTLTGADGIAIAMAEDNAIVCRASAGSIAPEPGARLDPKSGFSGACLRTGGIVRCDDTETDPRVNVKVCRLLGTRSLVAVPIASAYGTIGLLEAFSAEARGFNDSDVRSLNLLAELILAALKPEEENRLAEISQRLVAEDSDETSAQGSPDSGTTALAPNAINNEPPTAPENGQELFQEYEKKQKSAAALTVIVLLVALVLALGAGVWWKFRHSPAVKPQTQAPTPAAASTPPVTTPAVLEKQPEPAPPVPAAEDDSPSTADDKSSARTLVTGIWHVSSADSSTVIIDMKGEVQYEAHRLSSPERIYFDLRDTTLAPGMFGKTIEIGDARIARVRIAQPTKGVSRVVLETTGASDFSVSLQSNPYRLVVEIRKAGPAEHGGALAKLPKPISSLPEPALMPVPPARAENKINGQLRARVPKFRLVLDAGHGGWDLGTVGSKGLME